MTSPTDTAVRPWAAPAADGPVDAALTVPGSKSATNRALILAALAPGTSRLVRPLRARDTLLMAGALRALGVSVEDDGADWVVTAPAQLDVGSDHVVRIDCGNAGTVARFVPPVAALAVGRSVVDGDPRMRERPLGPLLEALRALGADLDDGGRGALPVFVDADGRLAGGAVTVDASASSQLVSGLLLAAPRYEAGVTVRHVGPPVPSAPHLRMTVAALRAAGATVDDSAPDVWRVEPGALLPRELEIEPDLSTASAFLAAAAATGGRVLLRGWPPATEQPGRLLPDLLTAFGCVCTLTPEGLLVTGPDRLHGVDLDLHEYGEVTPTLAALCVLAEGPSRLRGVAHLRLQETDRLTALAQELGRLGARVAVTDDGLAIAPAPLSGARLDPRSDHRLAMAYAVVGLVVPGVLVDDVATTGKTVPDFPARWSALLRPGPDAGSGAGPDAGPPAWSGAGPPAGPPTGSGASPVRD